MLRLVIKFLVQPLCALIFGRAALAIFNDNGWFPEVQLAAMIVGIPTLFETEIALWCLSLFIALLVWLGLHLLAVKLGSSKLYRIFTRPPDLQFILEQKEPYIEINKIGTPGGNTDTQYFCRVGVRNNTNDTIRNVRVRLMIIKRLDNPLLPLNMKPRYASEDNVNLAPGEEEIFDIAQYRDVPDYDTEIVLCYAKRGLPNPIPKGKYRLRLVVFGETAPSEPLWVSLKVDKSGRLSFAPWIKRPKNNPWWRKLRSTG